MTDSIINLTKKLISIPSMEGNRAALYEILHIAKEELEGFTIEEFESNGIPSLLIHNTDKGTKKFKIILNAHLDVVPAPSDHFEAREENERLYGRGAFDMKAGAAIMILVFKQLASKLPYPIALQVVTDEEIGGFNGTLYQIQQGITADFVLAGEGGSNLQIKHKAKGKMLLKITTRGISSHGAYPWLGENAIVYMHDVINVIKQLYPHPKEPKWETTATISRIETENTAINRVPDHCNIYIDFRYVEKDTQTILKTIRKNLHEKVEMEVLDDQNFYYVEPTNQYLNLLKESVENITKEECHLIGGHGSSDVRFYVNRGVELGPKGGNHHGPNEWVDIQSLEDYYHILKNFLLAVATQ